MSTGTVPLNEAGGEYIFKGIFSPRSCYPILTGNSVGGSRVLVVYRYISWLLTSLFYITGPPDSPAFFKLGVVLALLAAGWLAMYIYSKINTINTLLLVTVETMGIAALLIPTGGLDSPFMWYALNPIFIAASLLPAGYCWGILGFFLIAATGGSVFLHGDMKPLLIVWQKHSWLLLVFLLLTTAATLFTRLVKQLTEACNKLSDAHQAAELLLNHISSLYQALEAFSAGEEARHLAGLLAEYAGKLTGSRASVCFLVQEQCEIWEVLDPDKLLRDQALQNMMSSVWQQIKNGDPKKIWRLPLEKEGTEDIQLVCVPMQSPGARFGLLGYVVTLSPAKRGNEEQAIIFLADLGAIVLERCKAEELAARLLVAEEQNRIANEIHDGVSQYLFSIVCGLHNLSQKNSLRDSEVERQLTLIKNTARQAARELRASIYNISPHKRGESVFLAGLAAYLDGVARLNGIDVEVKAEGSEDALSPALRKAFYRIVREAVCNALRHGCCKRVVVKLWMSPIRSILEIEDDGSGYRPESVGIQSESRGLGIRNMAQLSASFNGELEIESEPGVGTLVRCVVPKRSENELSWEVFANETGSY